MRLILFEVFFCNFVVFFFFEPEICFLFFLLICFLMFVFYKFLVDLFDWVLLFFSFCKMYISLCLMLQWYWVFLSTCRNQNRIDLREEASALYSLPEMTIVSLLALTFGNLLTFLISSHKWKCLLQIHEGKRLNHKPRTQYRISKTFSIFFCFWPLSIYRLHHKI